MKLLTTAMRKSHMKYLMKYLTLTLLLLAPVSSFGQSYTADWTITGLERGNDTFTRLSLDFDTEGRFIGTNGAIYDNSNLFRPLFGTCVFEGSGTLYCSLRFDASSLTLSVSAATLNGSIRLVDTASTTELDRGSIVLTALE
jgi:hypothetical protein